MSNEMHTMICTGFLNRDVRVQQTDNLAKCVLLIRGGAETWLDTIRGRQRWVILRQRLGWILLISDGRGMGGYY